MFKINSFKITGLTVEGFKNFAERQSFTFGEMTSITGHNGQGKSSIADAIAFAVTGVPYFGNEQSSDRLYTIGSKDAYVELDILTGDGAFHKLIRHRVKDHTHITLDGVAIKQSDLCEMFGERDVFLSIFNPLYFIEILGEKGRNLLERYLPVIPHETVMANLSDDTRTALDGTDMNAPDAVLRQVRDSVRELDASIIYSEGQRDLLDSQTSDHDEVINGKRLALATVEASIMELSAKRENGLDFAAMETQRKELYRHHDELSRGGGATPDTTAIDAELLAAGIRLETKRNEAYDSPYAAQMAETKTAIGVLLDRHKKETAIMNALQPGIQCPTCKTDVTEQNINDIRTSFAVSIAEIVKTGRTQTAVFAELEALDKKALAAFEQNMTADLQALENHIADLNIRREAVVSAAGVNAESRLAEMGQVKGQIQSLEAALENGNLTFEEAEELKTLTKGQETLEAEIAALAGSAPGAGPVAIDVERLNQERSRRKELETAVKFYIAERCRLLFADLKTMNRVKIQLYEIIKSTGEMKDVFRFTYEDKPYKFLSLSEKIKSGLELSELVKRLTGRNYPVFVDNGESIPAIDNMRPTGQVIFAQVVFKAPPSVSVIGGDAPAQSAAAA